MPILSVDFENFRNFKKLSCDFSPNINVITGQNAQGKTNLIEALFYLSTARSFRTNKDETLILHGENNARIAEKLHNGVRDFNLEIFFTSQNRKRIISNGILQKRSADIVGILPVVLFTPDDLHIIKAGAAERRRLLDIPLCQIRPYYLEALNRYNKTLRMKRVLIRQGVSAENKRLCDAYNAELSRYGADILCMRRDYLIRLAETAAPIHHALSGQKETLTLTYKTFSRADLKGNSETNRQLLYRRLCELMSSEFESENCLSGIHKDDILIDIDDYAAKGFASQGQMRSAALSLKLAEREIIRSVTATEPVLLLDDVLSELDPTRQHFILNHIGGGQIFITCCDMIPRNAIYSGKYFEFHNGMILREETI